MAVRNSPTKVWTIKNILDWSEGFFQEKSIESPRTNAELLLSDILDCKRMDLYLRFDQPLEPSELARYKAHVKRRARREPAQYILGEWEFWSLPLRVDSRVLIPRSETECMIEEIQKSIEAGDIPADGHFLDLCTGSGAIACALAQENPEATVDASDVSVDALAVARQNIEDLGLDERINTYCGDLFSALPAKQYDLIATNPPYVTSEEIEGLEEEVRVYEPRLALDGGADGLDLIRRIFDQAEDYLAPGGIITIEIGASQGPETLALAEATGLFAKTSIIRDYARRDRILFGQRKKA